MLRSKPGRLQGAGGSARPREFLLDRLEQRLLLALTQDYVWSWVESNGQHRVYAVDPANGQTAATLVISGAANGFGNEWLDYGDGYLWAHVAINNQHKVFKVDASSGQTLATVNISGAANDVGTRWFGYGAGYLWAWINVNGQHRVFKVDPATGQTLGTLLISGDANAFSNRWFDYGGGYLWAWVNSGGHKIFRVDPSNGQTLGTINVSGNANDPGTDWFAYGNGSFWGWVNVNFHNKIFRVDATSGQTLLSVDITGASDGGSNRRFGYGGAPLPTISVADPAPVAEGNGGSKSLAFQVSLSRPSEDPVTVQYSTSNGSAVAGGDYGATSGTLTIPARQTAATINVPVLGDASVEGDETFMLTLSSPVFGTIGDGQAVGTIVNDDAPPSVTESGWAFAPDAPGVRVAFSADVSASLDAGDLRAAPVGGGETVVPLGVNWDGSRRAATFRFAGGVADGNYRATILAGDVRDGAGNPLPADVSFAFFVLAGDANHDRGVDFGDLALLAQNYNMTGRTFANGDFDYDGDVDFQDLVILAQRYNTSLPEAAGVNRLGGTVGPRRAAPASARAVFSTAPLVRRPASRRVGDGAGTLRG